MHKTRSKNSIKHGDHTYLIIEFCEQNGFVHKILSPQQNNIVELNLNMLCI